MHRKSRTYVSIHHCSMAIQREQALCLAAVESRAYDGLTDEQWVTLCEQTNRDADDTDDARDMNEGISADATTIVRIGEAARQAP